MKEEDPPKEEQPKAARQGAASGRHRREKAAAVQRKTQAAAGPKGSEKTEGKVKEDRRSQKSKAGESLWTRMEREIKSMVGSSLWKSTGKTGRMKKSPAKVKRKEKKNATRTTRSESGKTPGEGEEEENEKEEEERKQVTKWTCPFEHCQVELTAVDSTRLLKHISNHLAQRHKEERVQLTDQRRKARIWAPKNKGLRAWSGLGTKTILDPIEVREMDEEHMHWKCPFCEGMKGLPMLSPWQIQLSKRAHLHTMHPGETPTTALAKSREVDKKFMRKKYREGAKQKDGRRPVKDVAVAKAMQVLGPLGHQIGHLELHTSRKSAHGYLRPYCEKFCTKCRYTVLHLKKERRKCTPVTMDMVRKWKWAEQRPRQTRLEEWMKGETWKDQVSHFFSITEEEHQWRNR